MKNSCGPLNPSIPNIKEQNYCNYPILFLRVYFSYKSTGEKLLKYQENSPWVIISSIFMASEVE